MNLGGLSKDRKLADHAWRIIEVRRREKPRSGKLAREHVDARGLFEPRIVRGGTGARQQLGNDRLVHVAVLPQVEHREMEAEHVDGAPQRFEPTGGERAAPWDASDSAIVSRSARKAVSRRVR